MAKARMRFTDADGATSEFTVSTRRDDPDAADDMVRRALYMATIWNQIPSTEDES